jgi:glycosyltransferase involved in cell wall biosynthesis
MKISFVIPAFNEEAYLSPCLFALQTEIAQSARGFETEITDFTQRVAESYEGVRIVQEPRKGVSRARQRGLEESSGTIIVYLDADTTVSLGWFTKVIQAFSNDDRTVCVSGPYYYYDLPILWRVIAWPYEVIVGWFIHALTGQCVVGGNFAARRADLMAIGGFNTDIEFYGEDLDVAKRLKSRGRVRYSHIFAIPASARRFNAEGVLITTVKYGLNFLSVAILNKPLNASHRDVR